MTKNFLIIISYTSKYVASYDLDNQKNQELSKYFEQVKKIIGNEYSWLKNNFTVKKPKNQVLIREIIIPISTKSKVYHCSSIESLEISKLLKNNISKSQFQSTLIRRFL